MKLDLTEEELFRWVSKISEEFYVLAYDHPWFSKIFRNIDKDIITSQQTDFMVGALGGPKRFSGRMPQDAHPQIWVDDEIWEFREDMLKQAMAKVGAPEELCEKWLRIDEAFRSGIVNEGGPETCQGRYKTDEIIYEPIPEYLKKKKVA